jgi:hypothetical protein
VRTLKLVATIGSTCLLTMIGATPAAAAVHRSYVSGFEFYATSTQGRFAGSAAGQGANGLSGAWSIVVEHTNLGGCSPTYPACGQVTGGTFSLVVPNPAEVVSGSFNSEATSSQPNTIVLVEAGQNCTNQRFWIADGLHNVGAWEHVGTGSFGAYLTHYRHSIFGRCITYSATVQGTVELDF